MTKLLRVCVQPRQSAVNATLPAVAAAAPAPAPLSIDISSPRRSAQQQTSAYSKRVPRTNCALRIKKCAPRIFSGIYFLSTS